MNINFNHHSSTNPEEIVASSVDSLDDKNMFPVEKKLGEFEFQRKQIFNLRFRLNNYSR